MKYFILFLSLIISFYTCSQNKADGALTPNLINIPGTRVYLTPPPGFKLAKNFTGLEKDDRSYIEIYAPYGDSYTKNTANFSRPLFESKGLDVFAFKIFSVSGFSAKYVAMKGNTGSRKYDLMFGDSIFSVMVLGFCPLNDDITGKLLEKSILSITYDTKMKLNPYAGTSFTTNDSNSIFKFAKNNGTVFTFSTGGVAKTDYNDEPILTITPFTMESAMTEKDILLFMASVYKNYGMTGIKVKKDITLKIDGKDAVETEVYAKMNNKKVMLYEVTIVNDKKNLLILGIAKSDFDKNLEEFKKLAYTIKFK